MLLGKAEGTPACPQAEEMAGKHRPSSSSPGQGTSCVLDLSAFLGSSAWPAQRQPAEAAMGGQKREAGSGDCRSRSWADCGRGRAWKQLCGRAEVPAQRGVSQGCKRHSMLAWAWSLAGQALHRAHPSQRAFLSTTTLGHAAFPKAQDTSRKDRAPRERQ